MVGRYILSQTAVRSPGTERQLQLPSLHIQQQVRNVEIVVRGIDHILVHTPVECLFFVVLIGLIVILASFWLLWLILWFLCLALLCSLLLLGLGYLDSRILEIVTLPHIVQL